MAHPDVAPMTQTATPAAKPAPAAERDPIFDELGFPTDPDNLYLQTVDTMLHAAELLDLRHRVRIILAQPKNETMVHFPVRMETGTTNSSRATASSTTTPSARTRAASGSTPTSTSTTSRPSPSS